MHIKAKDKVKQLITILVILLYSGIVNSQTPIQAPPGFKLGPPIVDYKDGFVYSFIMSKDGEVKNSRKQLGNRATIKIVGNDYHIKFLDINGKKYKLVVRFWKNCIEECCGGLWNQYSIDGVLYCAQFSAPNKKLLYYDSEENMWGYSIESFVPGKDEY